MKKTSKRIVSALSVCSMFMVSLPLSISTTAESIQPRGSYHVYGDVDNSGKVTAYDASLALTASSIFKDLTGSKNLPLEYAIARPSVYFKDEPNVVPQAADTNGDGIINDVDANDILSYYAYLAGGGNSSYTGNCGKVFYIP